MARSVHSSKRKCGPRPSDRGNHLDQWISDPTLDRHQANPPLNRAIQNNPPFARFTADCVLPTIASYVTTLSPREYPAGSRENLSQPSLRPTSDDQTPS